MGAVRAARAVRAVRAVRAATPLVARRRRFLARGGCSRQRGLVRATSIVVEEVSDDAAAPELIALASAADASRLALCVVQGTDHVRFVAREHPGDAALLVVAVGDARRAASLRTLVELAQPRALFVAIVAVEALLSLAEIGVLARRFDAVLRVVVGREAEATAPPARALTAVTAFATADCISLPVEELTIHPFFSSSAARNAAIASAAERSLARPREMVMVPGGPPEDLPV